MGDTRTVATAKVIGAKRREQFEAPASAQTAPQVLSRLKLMSGMDITERRLCQDGHISSSVLKHQRDVRAASAQREAKGGEQRGEYHANHNLNAECRDQGATKPEMMSEIEQIFANIVVVRGDQPVPPSELLQITVPKKIQEQMAAAAQQRAAQQAAQRGNAGSSPNGSAGGPAPSGS